MKRLSSALAMSAITLSLTACGGSGGGGDASTESGSETDTATETGTETDTSTASALQNRLNQYAEEGYLCNNNNVCEKFDVEDSQYNGTYSMCDAEEGVCDQSTILNYAFKQVQENTIDSYAQFNTYYDNAVLNGCKLITDNYVGCSWTLENGAIQTAVASMQIYPQSASFEYRIAGEISSITLSVAADELKSEYALDEYYPELPTKPDSWLAQVPELSIILDNSTSDDWGGSDGSLSFYYNLYRGDLHTPVCEKTDEYSYSCSFVEQENLFYQCDYLNAFDVRTCSAYNERTEQITNLVDSQLSIMGFDKAVALGASYSKSHPVTVYDSVCDPSHNIIKGNLNNLYYSTADELITLNSNSQQDQSLVRFNNTDDWSGIAAQGHCTSVASAITQNDGAYVNMVGTLTIGAKSLADEGFELINNSWSMPFTTATTEHNSANVFNVWAGGNGSENWTELNEINALSKEVVWGTGLESNMIVVGGLNSDLENFETTATPGSNTNIQSRWIVALAVDVLTATTVAGSNDSMTLSTGTSFATPYVSRALALGKGFCPTSSYSDLSQVLLNTADKSFSGYAPEEHGQGLLDVEAFILQLNNYCP